MAHNDVRDILDVAPSSQPRPSKKAKMAASKTQYSGMSKEVRGLMMGDGIAPVQVQELQYKKKPKLAKRAQPWIREAFTNPARADGLVLKHWWKSTVPHRLETPGVHGAPVTPAESKIEIDSETKPPHPVQPNYPFARFNTKPDVPKYEDSDYDADLVHSDWTKHETDYLMGLARDFDLRWVIIWDRYDYTPGVDNAKAESAAGAQSARQRSMEDLKARYYQVAAKIMESHHPLASMSTAEFDIHEKMIKFDPHRETTRKKLAEALLARSPEELREEEILLGELKRIVDNEERFLEDRKELYRRLDFPASHGSIAGYETSTGLQQLAVSLASQERSKKQRRSLAEAAGSATSPAAAVGGTVSRNDQRATTSTNKRKSAAAAASMPHRQLSARDQVRYGISQHDRLSSGVSFRQSRIEKLVLAKSAAQAQKLHDALGELQVPVRAVMPTDRVCTRYENLIREIHLLLDARKISEKVNNEIKVLRAQKESREKKERGDPDNEDDLDVSITQLDGAGDVDGPSSMQDDGAADGQLLSIKGRENKRHFRDNDANGEVERKELRIDSGPNSNLREDADVENEDNGEEDDRNDVDMDAEGDSDDENADEDADGDEEIDVEGEEEEDEEEEEGDQEEDGEEDDSEEEGIEGEEEDVDEEQAEVSDAEAAVDDEGLGENEEGDVENEEEDGEDDEEQPNDEVQQENEEEEEEEQGRNRDAGSEAGEADTDDEADVETVEDSKPHKRSASVLSGNSTRSSKRTRR